MEGLGHTLAETLDVFWPQARVFGDSREHARAKFLTVMECEDEVGPTFARKCAV